MTTIRETIQQRSGRERRERADKVDALKLKEGEPIMYAGRMVRFSARHHRRADISYQFIRRLRPEEIEKFEFRERESHDRLVAAQAREHARRTIEASPQGKCALQLQHALDNDFENVVSTIPVELWEQIVRLMPSPRN